MTNLVQVQMMPVEARQEAQHHVESARVVGGTTRVSVNDGETTVSRDDRATGSVAQNNPHHGTDSILATAQHPKGLPVHQIEDTTLITVNGLQAPASFWAREGLLQKTADGSYVEAKGAPQAAPEAVDPDVVPIPQNHANILQAAIGDIPEQHALSISAAAIGEMTGKLPPGAMLAKLSSLTGLEGDAAAQRVQAMQAVFQAQTAGALVYRYGIDSEDLDSFFDYCRTEKRDAMQDALGRQVHGSDMTGWKRLATQYLSNTAPSVEALQRAGLPVRKSGHKAGTVEVFISGPGKGWMSPQAAAKAGLI